MVPDVKRRRVVSASVAVGKWSSSSDAVEIRSSKKSHSLVGASSKAMTCWMDGASSVTEATRFW